MSKKTHAFRRSGAQGLSDDRCPDPDINALGGWEQGEMRKSYVVGIPFLPVLMMAGFSGEPGDYYIGRAHAELDDPKEWEELQALFKKFIFPRLESQLAEDAIYKLNSTRKYQKILVENNLFRMECGQKDHEIGELKNRLAASEEREKKTAAELEQLKQELAALKAHAPTNANAEAAGPGTSASAKVEAGSDAPKPEKPQVTTPVRAFFDLVVKPWRDSKTVAEAWEHWVKVTFFMDGKTLSQLSSEKDFYPTFSYIEKGKKDDTDDKKMKRMRNVMLTVEKYRANESEEATRAAIAKIQKDVVDRSSISALADGVIFGKEPPPKRDNSGKDKTTENKRRTVGYLFFAAKMEGDAWGETMFGKDDWKQIKIEEPKMLAKLKK
ncbi:unnamed protein product [Closterium sp. Naga37s-1]|nr:unnamed protein product [Closterium sp. Naga37s-1]